MIEYKDRIKELRKVSAQELIPNPKNWRQHPEAQRDAMQSVLEQFGYTDALIARETKDGLMLIDGHLRAETTPDTVVPVLIVDVTEEEADVILATLDPLASMARPDTDSLMSLLDEISTDDLAQPINDMLEALVNGETTVMPWDEADWSSDIEPGTTAEDAPSQNRVVVVCPEHLRETVTDAIKFLIDQNDWEGVTVN